MRMLPIILKFLFWRRKIWFTTAKLVKKNAIQDYLIDFINIGLHSERKQTVGKT